MNSRWYCTDCETYIDADEVDDHEADGHQVKGMLRPERLLPNDPWQMGVEGEGDEEVTD